MINNYVGLQLYEEQGLPYMLTADMTSTYEAVYVNDHAIIIEMIHGQQ